MKKSDIVVNGLYRAKVSNFIVTLRVDAILNQTSFGGRARTTYRCTNLQTKREVVVKSATRFRCPAQIGV